MDQTQFEWYEYYFNVERVLTTTIHICPLQPFNPNCSLPSRSMLCALILINGTMGLLSNQVGIQSSAINISRTMTDELRLFV